MSPQRTVEPPAVGGVMIWQDAAGWWLLVSCPDEAALRYGPFGSWAAAFAVRRRIDWERHPGVEGAMAWGAGRGGAP